MKEAWKFSFLLSLMALSGCYPAFVFQMEGLEPAKISIPASVTSITVFSRIDIDSTSKPARIESAGKMNFTLDSLMAKEAVLGCVDELIKSPRFEVYDPMVKRNLAGDFTNPARPLPWNIIGEIVGDPPLDAALALESCCYRDTVISLVRDGWKTYSFLQILSTYWRLYELKNNQFTEYQFTDTLTYELWEVEEMIQSSPFDHFMVIEGMYETGKKTAHKIAPYWIQLERAYFPYGPHDFHKGARYMREGNWAEAAGIWDLYVDSRNSVEAAKACYNMAVTCELAGEISLALEWLAKSGQKGMHPYYINEYRKELVIRAEKNKLLDLQMLQEGQ